MPRSAPGAELLLDLAGRRGRLAVEEALRTAIRDGRLGVGARVPSSRSLAVELGLARNTVAEAYAQLVAEGWLTSRQGSGTFVARRPSRPPQHQTPTRPQPTWRFDLAPGAPDLAGFPRAEWVRATRRAMTSAPSQVFGYPDPRGALELRTQLVDYLGRVRGVRTTAELIMVCSGFQQALNLLASVLATRGGRRVAVESYGLAVHRDTLRAAGHEVIMMTTDAQGATVGDLDADIDAVLLDPAHQFPLGVALSPARRTAVVEWAAGSKMIIEDDYDGEFRFDRQPVGALQALAPEQVTYVGTASKSLAPAVGLGWLVMPPDLVDDVCRAKIISDGRTGLLEQLVLADLISSGVYERHVRRARQQYRRRRDQLVAVLGRAQPTVQVTGIAAGLHALVELTGRPVSAEADVCRRAAQLGLRVLGLDHFRTGGEPREQAALVVGYARPPDHAYGGALERLCDVLAG